jgi:maltose alpha-D-glucosyltransferase/alpha-amylase
MKYKTMSDLHGWPWLLLLALGCWTARASAQADAPPARDDFQGTNAAYVRWLEERSLLYQAAQQARPISGQAVQWRHPYGEPQPRAVVQRASVWLLGYGGSVIPSPGKSVLATWGDPKLWGALHEVGIDLLHTGPVNRAGGIEGRKYTPTIDGWFDPIALEIDPLFGTEDEYREMVKAAAKHGGLIAGDLVPLHTGKGADFRLAQMAYRDYPGMYTMVEIPKDDWLLLPEVRGPWASVAVPRDTAERLRKKGYLPGAINSNDDTADARELSGWSAGGEVVGVDGKRRRWVYLHYFKPGQPTLNWLDPSCAGPRAVFGHLTWSVHDLGAPVLRLDAVPFLGLEPVPGKPLTWHYQHPLAVNATEQLAFLTRKLGGWSFQELNVPLVELKKFTSNGPDLSYDFFTRTECLHALLTGDAAPLRQAFGFLLAAGVDPLTLVHDLQNHDEITYQLVELDHRKDEIFTLDGKKVTGGQLREQMLRQMRTKEAGKAAPYNHLYRAAEDGVATTFAGFVAAALDVPDPYQATAAQRQRIQRGHLLLAQANAMQPGVFSLSSWDLVGALPVPEKEVADLVAGADYRWINRGSVDLLGGNPDATKSAFGLPRARALYGPLPRQLADPASFASQLKRLLAARKQYGIALAKLLAVPAVKNTGLCVLVLQRPADDGLALTALNFGRTPVEEEVNLAGTAGMPAETLRGRKLVDAASGAGAGEVTGSGHVIVKLDGLTGTTLILGKPPE